MGTRFRKSVKLPGGGRINLSKSGVGYSWGVKGYRKTKTATGRTRTTYSVPGTGLSYVEESKKPETKSKSEKPVNQGSNGTKPVSKNWLIEGLLVFFILCLFTCINDSTHNPVMLGVTALSGIILLVMVLIRINKAKRSSKD